MAEESAKSGRPGRLMLENLRNAGPLLREGEVTRPHRVRAHKPVHEWWGSLSAEQRGDVLARVMAQEGTVEVGQGEIPIRPHPAPSRPTQSLTGVTALVVVVPHVPQRLRNDLRWDPERYTALEELLAQAGRLDLHRTNGKYTWRTPDGRTVRRDTVARLHGAGVLDRAY